LLEHERAVGGRSGEAVRLSKTKLTAFEICPRRFWLQIHRPDLKQHDARTLKVFAAGHLVGKLARARYPNGVLVSENHKEIDVALARTAELVQAPLQRVPSLKARS
jgi:hypothetical protein